MVYFMVRENSHGWMEPNIKENSGITKSVEMVDTSGQIAVFTLVK